MTAHVRMNVEMRANCKTHMRAWQESGSGGLAAAAGARTEGGGGADWQMLNAPLCEVQYKTTRVKTLQRAFSCVSVT